MSDVEQRRRRIGWSQDDLADVANVSPRTVWSVEHGRHVGAKSMTAIEAALSEGEQRRLRELGGRVGGTQVPLDPPKGTTVVDLSTPDGRVKIAVALEPDSDVDLAQLQETLLRLHERATRHRVVDRDGAEA